MDIHQMYKQKITSAENAVKVIKSGDWVDYGWAVTAPVALDVALSKRIEEESCFKSLKSLKSIHKANTPLGILGTQVA